METLRNAYKSKNIILFVGSGISSSIGVPSWSDIISEIARQLEYDNDILKTFGDYLALAEYYKIKKGSIGPLRSWMDISFHSTQKIETSNIHRIIANANFPIIYTTNYDRWIEKAFEYYKKPFHKIVNVKDFAEINNSRTQIIKFHGDFDDDNSIVLDETSYFKRLEFDSPLDIKLRSDIIGKTVLFIGYSLSDINIRILFYKLSKLWDNYSLSRDEKPKSYIFSPTPNHIQKEILQQWGITMLASNQENPSEALLEFMHHLTSI